MVTYTDLTSGDDVDSVLQDAEQNDVETFTTGQDGTVAVVVDVEVPTVTVMFEVDTHTATEGASATGTVELSAVPDRTVTIPITVTSHCGATSADYTGVPTSVTFQYNQTRQTFNLTASTDTASETPETVTLTFGTLPDKVVQGRPATTVILILDAAASTTHNAEYTCLDLPGDTRSQHLTYGTVRPGVTSTGELTSGVDTGSGLAGDHWRLETQAGHQYRLEVKFGTSQDIDTGGAAWTAFYDPRTGDSATCCESDHNRDDGRTVIYFEHDPLYPDHLLMVDVSAFDMFNEDSVTYSGPYEISLADVTGSKNVASTIYRSTKDSYTDAIGASYRVGLSVTTGTHAAGYRVDRIVTYVRPVSGQTDADLPRIALHADSSGSPATAALCNFDWPSKARDWPSGRRRPVVMPAPACANVVLAASTKYWVVMGKSGETPASSFRTNKVTATGFDANGSGWTVGDDTAVGNATSWQTPISDFRLPVEIWATSR